MAAGVMSGVTVRDEATRPALLMQLARQVTARHDLDDMLAEVFRCLRPMAEFGGGSIQLLNDDGWIQMAASDPVAPEHVRSQRIPLGASVAGRVILTECPIYLPDIAETYGGNGKPVSTGVRSYLGVPLVVDGRAIGLLQVDSPVADAWAEDVRDLFIGTGPIVAAAIQNARAHARAGEAKTQSTALESRLRESRQALFAARAAARAGDRFELERQLSRLDILLCGDDEDNVVRLPVQRLHAPVEAIRR